MWIDVTIVSDNGTPILEPRKARINADNVEIVFDNYQSPSPATVVRFVSGTYYVVQEAVEDIKRLLRIAS